MYLKAYLRSSHGVLEGAKKEKFPNGDFEIIIEEKDQIWVSEVGTEIIRVQILQKNGVDFVEFQKDVLKSGRLVEFDLVIVQPFVKKSLEEILAFELPKKEVEQPKKEVKAKKVVKK